VTKLVKIRIYLMQILTFKIRRMRIGLTMCAKMNGGGDPFYLKFWVKLTALE